MSIGYPFEHLILYNELPARRQDEKHKLTSTSRKGIGGTSVFLGFKNSFLESVLENKRNIGIPGSGTASWRVFLERNRQNVGILGSGTASWRVSLERNRWKIGTSGVQGQLPGECSWKGIGGM